MQATAAGIAADPGPRVAAIVARHERTLLRVARKYSLCHDDALDAYQRGLEIFVRRVATVDPATELAWLKVVVRHEAIAIRRSRTESLTGEEVDVDAFVPAPDRSVEDQIASGERVRRSAEALRALKPDEARALMMKAHGLSYEEIGERNGWTYTKVNRAITEGRRRFLRVYEGIEAGEECTRFAPIVEALAEGKATSAQVLEIRPHLRHCSACRATVRELHISRLRRASLFWPVFILAEPLRALLPRTHAAVTSAPDTPPINPELPTTGPPEPELPVNPDLPSAGAPPEPTIPINPDLPTAGTSPEPAMPVPEITDAGLTLPLEAPGGAEEIIETGERVGRIATLKQDIAAFLHRANASDVATGIHIASSAGGGRIATVAAVIGFCVSSIGAGTVCVVTGVLPDPLGIVRQDADSPKRRADPPRPARNDVARDPAPTPATRFIPARATPTPTPRPEPRREPRRRRPSPASDPAQGTKPTSHQNSPISPPPATASREPFTPEAPSAPTQPAAAPATGGGEFRP
jgi:RNA polymerase sigma factor (sigma-70 family)